MISRRNLLTTVALAVPVVAVASCAGSALTPAEVIASAQAAVSGLSGMLTQWATNASPTVSNAIRQALGYLSTAQTVVNALVPSTPATQSASAVQTVEGYINSALGVLSGPPVNGLIPAPFNVAIAAVDLVLPTLESFVNTYLTGGKVGVTLRQPAVAMSRAAVPPMTVDQALSVLKSYATK